MQSVPVESNLYTVLNPVALVTPVSLTEPAARDMSELVTSSVKIGQWPREAKEDVSIDVTGDDWAYCKSDN